MAQPDTTERWHGTTDGYANHGCRCVDCRRAAARYNVAYRQRRVAAGTCIECDAAPYKGRVRCLSHLMARSAYAKRVYRAKGAQ